MKKFFGLSLRRFSQASTAALIALVLAGAARADTVFPYLVDGTATNISGGSLGSCPSGAICPFSGRLLINPVAGTLDAVDITFPGLPTFGPGGSAGPINRTGVFQIGAGNSAGNSLFLTFTPTRVLFFPEHNEYIGTLVAFQGADLVSGGFAPSEVTGQYFILNGDITVVPEPSSLALLGTGLFCCLGFALVRCRSKEVLSKQRGTQAVQAV